MILSFALATSLLITQRFTCFSENSQVKDRVVVSLMFQNTKSLPEVGTLSITAGLDSEGDRANSGNLPITLDTDNAAPSAEDEVSYSGEDQSSRYRIILPTATIGHASKNLRIRVMLENADRSSRVDFEMSCYSNIAGSEAPRFR